MKVLNRNQELIVGSPMRGVRAQTGCLLAALALAGCIQTGNQVAMAPHSDLDTMAYGQPSYYSPPPVASADSGGAISALRASFAASPRDAYTPVENAYAAAPVSTRHDAPYHLDAGDKLRVVVFGQEGLTNTYAIDAGGAITMPLIGAVPAHGRTTAGLVAAISQTIRHSDVL